ncbi:MAG TPA: hypothetical protein PLP19_08865 [bacterium]|nr:hypothetical protein [bacterium]HPN43585.1 hypothetical protein [bacterium]
MKILQQFTFLLILLPGIIHPAWSAGFENPRLALVISESSFQQRWGVTQMSAHGWAAVANLAGIPYDCLFLEQFAGDVDLSRYQLLVLGQCTYVADSLYNGILSSLKGYLDKGGHLIIDGPLAINNEKAAERTHAELDELLGIEYTGFHGDADFRIKVANNRHYITRMFEQKQFITQPLVNGLNILAFKALSDTLLISTNEKQAYPFLIVRDNGVNRITLVNDFSTWAGAASFFRNNQPQVFYANQLFNVLIRAVHWSLYGDIATPFPAPCVSNANMTAIIRLDADASGNLDAQIKTINYLVDIAQESGVVPLYAWLSSQATKAGWPDLAPLGKKIEDIGGQIGTHSKYHRIDREMTEERWQAELDGSIEEIEFNTSDYEYPIGKVEFFINPGNTIHMDDYGQIAKRFSFYMTHGFEQDMPLGFGNLTWYTGANKNLVVLEDVPSPDYQWFYDSSWSYTTSQIAAYEEAVFDHIYNNIGRGVIFNEMWHDYSITSQPQKDKKRIMNTNNLPFYDAIKNKFATHSVYCPDPVDLGNKLRAMAQWNYSWSVKENQVELVLDLSDVLLDTVAHYTGGMGISMENTPLFIRSVKINGKSHYAYNDRLIILPNLLKGKNTITVELRDCPSPENHLTFISKRMPLIVKNGADLETTILTRSRAKFEYAIHEPCVLLNADEQEWNRKGDGVLRASVFSDRRVILRKLANRDFMITACNVGVVECKESNANMQLILNNKDGIKSTFCFYDIEKPSAVLFGNEKLDIVTKGDEFQVSLPKFNGKAELVIKY